MDKVNILPLILCGGSGTRLWPLSTNKCPKQFQPFDENNDSLLNLTRKRVKLITEIEPFFITNQEYVASFLKNDKLILEQHSCDTAPAIARGLQEIQKESQNNGWKMDQPILILPSDHYIENLENFVNDIKKAFEILKDDIILFGIKPRRAETKFGYILQEQKVSFKEKPQLEEAYSLIEKGALWNSGIVLARLGTLINNYHIFANDIWDDIVQGNISTKISFDVIILQRTRGLTLFPCHDWGWDDVGTWEAWIKIANQTSCNSNVILHECSETSIFNPNSNRRIVCIGTRNLLIVDTKDNLLICENSSIDELKKVVSTHQLS